MKGEHTKPFTCYDHTCIGFKKCVDLGNLAVIVVLAIPPGVYIQNVAPHSFRCGAARVIALHPIEKDEYGHDAMGLCLPPGAMLPRTVTSCIDPDFHYVFGRMVTPVEQMRLDNVHGVYFFFRASWAVAWPLPLENEQCANGRVPGVPDR